MDCFERETFSYYSQCEGTFLCALEVEYKLIKKRSKPLGLSSGKLHTKSRINVKSFYFNGQVGDKDTSFCHALKRPVG